MTTLNPNFILLVHPLGYPASSAQRDISRIAKIMPPIGLASIAAYLKTRRQESKIVDCFAYPDSDRLLVEYSMLVSENTRQFLAKSMVYWPVFIKRIEDGLSHLQKLLDKKQYNCIVSDARYDMYSKKIPSFFISHQMRIMNPLQIKMFERAMERFNLFYFKRYVGIMVPDYSENNLSGDLSHNLRRINQHMIHYVGVLSDFMKRPMKRDIDYLISISGPEPQRSILEEKLASHAHELEGNVVMTLGKAEKYSILKKEHLTTYSFVTNRSRRCPE